MTSPPTARWRWPASTCCRRASAPKPSRAAFEGGYRFATPFVGITPYVAAQAISFNLPAYAEQVLGGAGVVRAQLRRADHDRNPHRTRPSQRQIVRDAGRHPDAARPRGLGA